MGLLRKIFMKKTRDFEINSYDKYLEEHKFWKEELNRYVKWYNGDIDSHYGVKSPKNEEKIKLFSLEHSAIATWLELHQKIKYLEDLKLSKNVFSGKKLLDIGSGPIPSAEVFDCCELCCLDPLLPKYLEIGYPIHIYKNNTKFVNGYSEKMPFLDKYFDAIISVNAIDHVDDICLTSKEICRVLKPGGMIRMHVHYHAATATEPIEINDYVMKNVFSWCNGFNKIGESDIKKGSVAPVGEVYTLWSNF